jgi:hypothetical protein
MDDNDNKDRNNQNLERISEKVFEADNLNHNCKEDNNKNILILVEFLIQSNRDNKRNENISKSNKIE